MTYSKDLGANDLEVHTAKLTHWCRVTHICVSKLTIIGSDYGVSPDRRQAIIWTNARLLLIGPLGKNFSEILIKVLTFSFNKMRLKVSSAKRRPFCLGLNELTIWDYACDKTWAIRSMSICYHIMMLVKFRTSANHKHWIWSCDESGLCNPRPRLLGDEVLVGSSLMFRKMDPWNILLDKINKKSTVKRNGTQCW